MARGGARPGAGRPRGKGNAETRELVARLKAMPEDMPLEQKLAAIGEDLAVSQDVRLCACRHLAGWLAGRVVRVTGLGNGAEILE